MRRTVIVGNGFIHHLKSIVQLEIGNYSDDAIPGHLNTLASELNEVTELFSQFEKLESEFRDLLKVEGRSVESVYQLVDDILTWYQTRSAHGELSSQLEDCLNHINRIGEQLINEKIQPITKGFEDQETKGVYANLTHFTGNKVGDRIQKKLNEKSDKLGVFTTNYDGFLEQVLRTSDSSNFGFLLKDGFAGSADRPKTLYDDYFCKKRFIGHLHSSYKYGWNGENWEKHSVRNSGSNRNPLIVYMNPKQKLGFIKRNEILRRYWNHFEFWLKESDEVAIYGNSLSSDPHILNALSKCKSEASFFIADSNPAAIEKRLKKESDNHVTSIVTSKIGIDKLADLFINPSGLVD